MLKYKKPVFWIIAVSIIAVVAVSIGLMANSKSNVITKKDKQNPSSVASKASSQVTTDLEQSISNALLSYYADSSDSLWYEVAGEGHITLDTEEKDGLAKTYILEEYLKFGFENEVLTEISGHSANVAILSFEKSSDGGYIFKNLKAPLDDSEYNAFIKDLFSASALEKLIASDSEKNRASLDEQCEAYARAYLEKIGRKADVQIYKKEKPMPNINAKISNYLLETYSEYPYWIGTREIVENGTRYVYELSWQDMGNQNGIITLTKSIYKGDIVEKTVIEVKGDKMKII